MFPVRPPVSSTSAGEASLVIYSPLDMLVTSEPAAELDHALGCLCQQLQQARARRDADSIRQLYHLIDQHLDERNALIIQPA